MSGTTSGLPSTSKTTSRSSVLALDGSPSPASISPGSGWSTRPIADDTDVDDLDLGVEAVSVLGLVSAVERLPRRVDPAVVDRSGRDVEAHLVALAGVAAVGEPADEPALLGYAVGVELGERLRRRARRSARSSRVAVERLQGVPLGGDELVLEVGREQPGRRR